MGGAERSHSDEDPEKQVRENLSIIYIDSIIGENSLPVPSEVAFNFYSYKKNLREKVGNPIMKGIVQDWGYEDLISVAKGQEGYGWRLVEELLKQAEVYTELEFPREEK